MTLSEMQDVKKKILRDHILPTTDTMFLVNSGLVYKPAKEDHDRIWDNLQAIEYSELNDLEACQAKNNYLYSIINYCLNHLVSDSHIERIKK